MATRNFWELIEAQWDQGKFACVGLDLDIKQFPTDAIVRHQGDDSPVDVEKTLFTFATAIIDAVADIVACVKPNAAFWEQYGWRGVRALEDTIRYTHEHYSYLPVIRDGKDNDIGSTCAAYATAIFDVTEADATTVNPYLGAEALSPLLERTEKGIFVLCKTSNPGAGEFQDLEIPTAPSEPVGHVSAGSFRWEHYDLMGYTPLPLYQRVALNVSQQWNTRRNCGLVFGATYAQELKTIREIDRDIPLLIPGIGKQGGNLEETVRAALRRYLINSSRDSIYAYQKPEYMGIHFAEATRQSTQKLHDAIREIMIKDVAREAKRRVGHSA